MASAILYRCGGARFCSSGGSIKLAEPDFLRPATADPASLAVFNAMKRESDMFGAVQGLFVLAFSLAITGLLPGFISAIVIGAVALLAVAWMLVFLAAPIVFGIISMLR